MSTSAAPTHAQRLALFYREMIGKKIAMALSGVVLFGYVVIHMAGNLQIFAGRAQINGYAQQLHFGAGGLSRIGEIVRGLGLRRVLLVTTAGRAESPERPNPRSSR